MMVWRFWRRRHETATPEDIRGLHEAKRTLRDAEILDHKVRAVVDETRRHRSDTHFGEMFEQAFYLKKERHP